MRPAEIQMPRVNANEDEAKVVAFHVAEGDAFESGTLLFSVETTKASVDQVAPCAGVMGEALVELDALVAVGDPVCRVQLDETASSDELDFRWLDGETAEAAAEQGGGKPKISAKAAMRARELGIAIEDVPASAGRVRVEDVEAHARGAGRAPASAPAILDRYAANDTVLFGGGGHAKVLIDAARATGLRVIGAVDARLPAGTPIVAGIEVLGDEALLEMLRDKGVRTALIGVGGATSSTARAKVFDRLAALGFDLPPVVAPGAHLGLGSELGRATYLLAGANVGPAVTIGDDCIVNQNAVVAHDSRIGHHVHLAPNAVVAGHCTVGDFSTVGMCATLINGASIGANCLVHNNVAVTSDLPDGQVLTLRNSGGNA